MEFWVEWRFTKNFPQADRHLCSVTETLPASRKRCTDALEGRLNVLAIDVKGLVVRQGRFPVSPPHACRRRTGWLYYNYKSIHVLMLKIPSKWIWRSVSKIYTVRDKIQAAISRKNEIFNAAGLVEYCTQKGSQSVADGGLVWNGLCIAKMCCCVCCGVVHMENNKHYPM